MGKPSIWTFEGYKTPAGGKIIQDWFDYELDEDERDAIRDEVSYLVNVERHLWVRPRFDKLDGEICEIRCKCNMKNKVLRLYGFFPERRHHFTILHGGEKKKGNDRAGKRIALDHLSLIKQGKAGRHEFDFEEKPNPKNSPR
jgi:hypothetical protein